MNQKSREVLTFLEDLRFSQLFWMHKPTSPCPFVLTRC